IHYQPQYEFENNKLVGFEALSRWMHKDLGYISPDVFIRIAEDIGLHFEFDLWVFTQVCHQIVQWREEYVYSPRIAINISFKTLEMTDFVTRLQSIIEHSGCPTNLLEIEVTETASISNMITLIDNVRAVKKLGINIAIDDFGTGYSSLSLVRTLRSSLDTLKIDRSLVADICSSPLDREFARKVIGLGEVLEVKVLAEGVETLAQRDLLQELGCDYAQGYYFDKALTVKAAEKLIIKQRNE
ncbi:MAG: EAL domain-containing protein, partial [Moritella sp.]|uniref:EAL domain-containing protein n=2 Tax=unclassified Moritella TaxID=2637987 RepID=UPI002171786F